MNNNLSKQREEDLSISGSLGEILNIKNFFKFLTRRVINI